MANCNVFRSLSCKTKENILNAFNHGEFCDASLCTDDGERIQLHRYILITSSRFFNVLLRDDGFLERNSSEYHVGGMAGPILRWIVNWAYDRTSENLNHDNVHEIIVDADYLNVPSLVKQCSQLIAGNLTFENAIEEYQFSKFYHLLDLKREIFVFLRDNLKAVSASGSNIGNLSLDDMLALVSSNELFMIERDIFSIVIDWVAYEEIERKQFFPQLLREIRLALIPFHYLLTEVRRQKYILKNEECLKTVDAALFLRRRVDSHDSISQVPKASIPRYPKTVVFAVAGWERFTLTDVVEVFIPGMNYWLQIQDANPMAHCAYYATAVINSTIYFIGGYDGSYLNSCWCYNTITRKWKELAPMYYTRCYCSAAVVGDHIYAMGGFDGRRRHKTVERYDPQKNQWTLVCSMISVRSDAGATTCRGMIYIVGGFNGNSILKSAERYAPELNVWSELPDMYSERNGTSCVALGDYIYAIGGYDGLQRLRSMERFTLASSLWEAAPRMITERSNFGADIVDGKILVAGGYSSGTTISEAEIFCPQHLNWVRVCPLTHPRSAMKLVSVTGLSKIRGHIEEARRNVYGD